MYVVKVKVQMMVIMETISRGQKNMLCDGILMLLLSQQDCAVEPMTQRERSKQAGFSCASCDFLCLDRTFAQDSTELISHLDKCWCTSKIIKQNGSCADPEGGAGSQQPW